MFKRRLKLLKNCPLRKRANQMLAKYPEKTADGRTLTRELPVGTPASSCQRWINALELLERRKEEYEASVQEAAAEKLASPE